MSAMQSTRLRGATMNGVTWLIRPNYFGAYWLPLHLGESNCWAWVIGEP